MSPDRLIYMANQIGRFFASQGPDEAVAGTADHIEKFWTSHARHDPRACRGRRHRARTAGAPGHRTIESGGLDELESLPAAHHVMRLTSRRGRQGRPFRHARCVARWDSRPRRSFSVSHRRDRTSRQSAGRPTSADRLKLPAPIGKPRRQMYGFAKLCQFRPDAPVTSPCCASVAASVRSGRSSARMTRESFEPRAISRACPSKPKPVTSVMAWTATSIRR